MCPHTEVSESMWGLGPHLFALTSTQKRDNKTLLSRLWVFSQTSGRVIVSDYFLIPQHLLSCSICAGSPHAHVFLIKASLKMFQDGVNQNISFDEVWGATSELSSKCVLKCWTFCPTLFILNEILGLFLFFLFTLNFASANMFFFSFDIFRYQHLAWWQFKVTALLKYRE